MATPPDAGFADTDRGRALLGKLRRVLSRVTFTETLLAVQYAVRDGSTPVHVKATLVAALAYFIAPIDLIPDFIAGLGFTDDAAILATAVRLLAPYITPGHHEKAKRLLQRLRQ